MLGRRAQDYTRYNFWRAAATSASTAPGVDLPVVWYVRSEYAEYPEYHTSKDDLSLITPTGLQGSFEVLRDCCVAVETEPRYRASVLGEPQMGRRGLYATLGGRGVDAAVRMRMNILAYCDGNHALADIADILGVSAGELAPLSVN